MSSLDSIELEDEYVHGGGGQTFVFEELVALNHLYLSLVTFQELDLLSSLVLPEKTLFHTDVKIELLSKLRRGINRANGIFRNEGLGGEIINVQIGTHFFFLIYLNLSW